MSEATAPTSAPLPELVVTVRWPGGGDGLIYRFQEGPVNIGRDPQGGLHLPDPSVSPVHLQLLVREGAWHLLDPGSAHGSSLRGVPLAPGHAARLRTTEVATVGPYVLDLYQDRAAAPTTNSHDTDRMANLLAQDVLERGAGLWWVWVRAGGPEDGRPVRPGLPLRLAAEVGEHDLLLNAPELAGQIFEVWPDEAGLRVVLGGHPAIATWPVHPDKPAQRIDGQAAVHFDEEAVLHIGPVVLRLAPPSGSARVRLPVAPVGARALTSVDVWPPRPPVPPPSPPAAPRPPPPRFTAGELVALVGLSLLMLVGLGVWIWG